MADYIFVEKTLDLAWLWEVNLIDLLWGLAEFFFDYLDTEGDALVTNEYAWASNELANLLLHLSAERALEQVARFAQFGHEKTLTAQSNKAGQVSPAFSLVCLLLRVFARTQNLINQTVFECFGRGQNLVAVDVAVNLGNGLLRVLRESLF